VVIVAAAGTIVTIEARKTIWRTLARTDSTICTSGFYVGTKCTCLLAYMKTAVRSVRMLHIQDDDAFRHVP
jgi:hypothetical protein